MRRKATLIAVVILLVAVALLSQTHADISHDPRAPIAISSDQRLEFSLIGSRGGGFAFYSIEYPGDGTVVTIELDLAPGDSVAMNAAGFNVYGPNGYFIGSGSGVKDQPGRKRLTWSDFNPARWLIQVYNYLEPVPMLFHLQVNGLPEPEPVVQRAELFSPAAASEFAMGFGELLGDKGGSFHYYKIESEGDNSEVQLYLYHTPHNHLVAQGFGMNVYAPENALRVATAIYGTKFRLELPGTYLVQVFNYLHGVNVQYVLTQE